MIGKIEKKEGVLPSELSDLLGAVEEVTECLILENMQRPSFTFRRINLLAEAFTKYNKQKSI